MTSSVVRGPANLGAETRLIACDQIMAINGSSAMDQTACKLVPVPAQKLPEFNLSPQVRGRKRAACVSKPVCIGCIICTLASNGGTTVRLRAKFPASWNPLHRQTLNDRVRRECRNKYSGRSCMDALNFEQVFGHQRGFREPRRCNANGTKGEAKLARFHLRRE